MGADNAATSIHRHQICQNFVHMTDRQRVMPFAFDEARRAIAKPARNVFRDLDRESTIFGSMPETHRNIDIFKSKPPWHPKNLRIVNKAFNRGSPGATLTFKTRLKCD